VDVLGSDAGKQFWASLYGGKADPALNLPSRFSPNWGPTNALTGWEASIEPSRKKMRGFFLRKAQLNPVTNDYDYLADTPVAGDKVRIDARVYNYSTAVAANNLKVRFQVVGYDSDNDTEIALTTCPGGTPTNGRCTIGETLLSLNSLQMQTAWINWDTTGFGPAQAGAALQYRVYVVLDPDNTIDETYETEDPNTTYAGQTVKGLDPGQNNEGFGYVTVNAASQSASQSATPDAALDADVSLRTDALAASNRRGSVRTDNIPAEINRPLPLRVRVHSDRAHRELSHLLVYDGNPEKGGRLIAAKLIHSGNVKGSSVWFEWTPRTSGTHMLYARVVEKYGDTNPGNNTDTMTVNVAPADTTPPRLEVTLTPNRLWPPDERMVKIKAAVAVVDNQDHQPHVRLEAITHNEANDASADVAGAEFGTDDRTFRLRAESSGRSKEGRVYEVVYSVTDWAGNKTFAKSYVRVPHGRGKTR